MSCISSCNIIVSPTGCTSRRRRAGRCAPAPPSPAPRSSRQTGRPPPPRAAGGRPRPGPPPSPTARPARPSTCRSESAATTASKVYLPTMWWPWPYTCHAKSSLKLFLFRVQQNSGYNFKAKLQCSFWRRHILLFTCIPVPIFFLSCQWDSLYCRSHDSYSYHTY